MGDTETSLTKLLSEEGNEYIPFPIDNDKCKLISGFFVASEIDWISLEEDLKKRGYRHVKNHTKEKSVKSNIYQAKRFEKIFDEAHLFSIDLGLTSLSEKEILSFIPHHVKKNEGRFVDSDRVISWLNDRKGLDAFYYFVKFEIYCEFILEKMSRDIKQKIFEINSFLKKSAELIAQQIVYFDFRESIATINVATKTKSTIEINEKTKDETKTGINRGSEETTFFSKISTNYVSPFSYFLRKNKVYFKANYAEKESKKKGKKSFILGKKMLLKISKVKLGRIASIDLHLNHSKDEPEKIESKNTRFHLLINSTYFEFNPAFYNVKENGAYYVQISPIVEKISAEKRLENGYPIILTLIDTFYGVVYSPAEFHVILNLPELNIDIKRRKWPYKGWPIEVLIVIDGSELDVDVPVTVKGNVGPDFVVNNPPPEDETKKTKFQCIIDVKSGALKKTHEPFTLKAQRSGVWPFKNEAFFQFSIGSWIYKIEQKSFWIKSVSADKLLKSDFWKMTFSVFPAWYDTFVAGLLGVYLIASAYYPFILPSLTEGLTAENITVPTSAIYLAYRVINWARALQSESK